MSSSSVCRPVRRLRSLWSYQHRAYAALLEEFRSNGSHRPMRSGIRCRPVTLVGRQGCGKTTISVAVAATLVGDRILRFRDGTETPIRGVVFSPPFRTIAASFEAYDAIHIPPGSQGGRHIDLSPWWTGRLKSSELIEWFQGGHQRRPLTAATHKMMRDLLLKLPADLTGFFLVLDEAHHAPLSQSNDPNLTGALRDEWLVRGGLVLQTTATPWHTASQALVYEPSDPLHQIPTTLLAELGIGPKHFDVERVALPYEATDLKEMLDPLDVDVARLTEAYSTLVEAWKSRDRPVLLIRPPDNKHVEPLSNAFGTEGARVFNATGKLSPEKRAQLRSEVEITDFRDRTIDVVIASRQFDEGTDLPTISTVFYLGSPTSLRHVLQVLGRALRDRSHIAGCPKRHSDRASMVFFVPKPSKSVQADYVKLHHEDAIGIATYLADYQTGHEVVSSLSRRLRESMTRSLPPQEHPQVDSTLQRLLLTEHDRSMGTALLWGVAREMVELHDLAFHELHLTPALALRIASMPQDAHRATLERAFGLHAAASVPAILQRLESKAAEIVTRRKLESLSLAEVDRSFRKALHEIVSEVATEWDHLTTSTILNAELVGVLTAFTNTDAASIAKEIRRRIPKPTRSELYRGVLEYIRTHGTHPTSNSGSADRYGLQGLTWKQIHDRWAIYGCPGKSLAEFGRVHVRGP